MREWYNHLQLSFFYNIGCVSFGKSEIGYLIQDRTESFRPKKRKMKFRRNFNISILFGNGLMTHVNLPPEPILKGKFPYKDCFPGLFPEVTSLLLQLIHVEYLSSVTQVVGSNAA